MNRIVIEIERVLAQKGISKTQLCYMCRLQRTQLNRYCRNEVTRVDLHTLEKICDYLQCDVNDILRLVDEEKLMSEDGAVDISEPEETSITEDKSKQ